MRDLYYSLHSKIKRKYKTTAIHTKIFAHLRTMSTEQHGLLANKQENCR